MVWNHPDVAILDFAHQLLQSSRPKITNGVIHTLGSGIFHYTFEKWCTRSVNPKLCAWHRLFDSRQRFDGKVQPVPLDDRTVIHDHKASVAIFLRARCWPRLAKRENLLIG